MDQLQDLPSIDLEQGPQLNPLNHLNPPNQPVDFPVGEVNQPNQQQNLPNQQQNPPAEQQNQPNQLNQVPNQLNPPPNQPNQPLNPPPNLSSPMANPQQLNWSYFKPEFAEKPEEDSEAHLLRTNDWMETHNFPDDAKVRRFCLTLTGEARLWYETLGTAQLDWAALQDCF